MEMASWTLSGQAPTSSVFSGTQAQPAQLISVHLHRESTYLQVEVPTISSRQAMWILMDGPTWLYPSAKMALYRFSKTKARPGQYPLQEVMTSLRPAVTTLALHSAI